MSLKNELRSLMLWVGIQSVTPKLTGTSCREVVVRKKADYGSYSSVVCETTDGSLFYTSLS